MNLAIVGYGKMGRLIEQLAPQYELTVTLKLDEYNNSAYEGMTRENFAAVNVAVVTVNTALPLETCPMHCCPAAVACANEAISAQVTPSGINCCT